MLDFELLTMVFETERLRLRKLDLNDVSVLHEILGDTETMRFYPRPLTLEEVEKWIIKSIRSYEENNFGLWAIITKSDQQFIGDCGITLQNIDGAILPELGYHIHKSYWNKGYATEAAQMCIHYAWHTLHLDALYTYTSIKNKASISVAKKNGMQFVKHFHKTIFGELVEEVLYKTQKTTKEL